MFPSNDISIDRLIYFQKKFDYRTCEFYGIRIGDTIDKLNRLLLNPTLKHYINNREKEFVIPIHNKTDPNQSGGFKHEEGFITGFWLQIADLNLNPEKLRTALGTEDKISAGGDMFDDEHGWYRDVSDDIFIYAHQMLRFKKNYLEAYFSTVHIGAYKTEEDE